MFENITIKQIKDQIEKETPDETAEYIKKLMSYADEWSKDAQRYLAENTKRVMEIIDLRNENRKLKECAELDQKGELVRECLRLRALTDERARSIDALRDELEEKGRAFAVAVEELTKRRTEP